MEMVDASTVRYRHCLPGEASGLSLVQVGEGIDLNGGGDTNALGDTDDLYKEDLIPELGESDDAKVKETLAAKPATAASGPEDEAQEDAQHAVKKAQMELDAARKRAEERAASSKSKKGEIKAAVKNAVNSAVTSIADTDVSNAMKKLRKANARLTKVTGK